MLSAARAPPAPPPARPARLQMTSMNWISTRGSRFALLATLLLLGGASWWLTGVWQEHETRSEVQRAEAAAELELDDVAGDFTRALAYIRSIPLVIANEQVVQQTLSDPGHGDAAALNTYLGFIARVLHADL